MTDLIARLKFLASPDAERISDFQRINGFVAAAWEAVGEIERLTELAKLQRQEISITRERDEALEDHLRRLAIHACDEPALAMLDAVSTQKEPS